MSVKQVALSISPGAPLTIGIEADDATLGFTCTGTAGTPAFAVQASVDEGVTFNPIQAVNAVDGTKTATPLTGVLYLVPVGGYRAVQISCTGAASTAQINGYVSKRSNSVTG